MPRLLALLTMGLFGSLLIVGCTNEQGATGYCLSDSECQSGTCNANTRRCGTTTDQGYLSDTELARKLDMMIVDMAPVDMLVVDVAVPDTALPDAAALDQTLVLVDAAVDQEIAVDSALMDMRITDSDPPDTSASDAALGDARLIDAETQDMNATDTASETQD